MIPPGDETPTAEELEAALGEILAAPRDAGRLELIVRRPAVDRREVVASAELDPRQGLVGDNWIDRARVPGSPNPDTQLTLMSSRVAQAVARDRARWPLAGDQLYVDLDLGEANLPPGTRLAVGEAEIEITAVPHAGCRKFVARFGGDALAFVNARERRPLRLRGVYARVLRGGAVRAGDSVRKL